MKPLYLAIEKEYYEITKLLLTNKEVNVNSLNIFIKSLIKIFIN